MKAGEVIMRSPEIAAGITRITGIEPNEAVCGIALDVEKKMAELPGSPEILPAFLIAPKPYTPKLLVGVSIDKEELSMRGFDEAEYRLFANRRMTLQSCLTGLTRILPERQTLAARKANQERAKKTATAIKCLTAFSLNYATDYEPARLDEHPETLQSLQAIVPTKLRKAMMRLITPGHYQ